MTTLRIMPREMRLMSERILSLTGLPKGYFHATIDHVMYSQKLALGGFALLEQRFDVLCQAVPAKIAITREDASTLDLDAAGQHAWFVVPSVLDFAGELVAHFGEARITVSNVVDPIELKVAQAMAGRTGLSVTFTEGDAPVLTARAQPRAGTVAQDDPTLWALLCDGVEIEADLWWRTYHHAKKALAADTVVSRRHAGPMIVAEDGTVIGRKDSDDETDISFLVAPGHTATQGENAHDH